MVNIFEAIPKDLNAEVFETLAKSDHVEIERIVSNGHVSSGHSSSGYSSSGYGSPESGWYDQEKNEWVIVLKGEACIQFEDAATVILQQGDYINIKAHQKHKVSWTTPCSETIWLAIHYD